MHLRFHEIFMNQSITLCNIRTKFLIIKEQCSFKKYFAPSGAQFYPKHGFKFDLKEYSLFPCTWVFTRYLLNQLYITYYELFLQKLLFCHVHSAISNKNENSPSKNILTHCVTQYYPEGVFLFKSC